RLDLIDYHERNSEYDKAASLKYISNTLVNLYKLDNEYNYLFGEMPIDTSYLKWFKLTRVESNGLVLRFPNIYLNCDIVDYEHHDKLFEEFKRNHDWCNHINQNNISDLNKAISSGNIKDLIYMCEINQNGRLLDIARTINANNKIKIVLIAGPSSSGKTTTSKKLSLYLKSFGLKPHSISIDNYFLSRDQTPKNEHGERDFESLTSINVNLFNEQLGKLLTGEEVILPEYNFLTGESEFKDKRLKLGEKDILIIEGLHALNEELTKAIDEESKYKIYVSPLTSVNLDNHNRISTSDNRLLRRMIRDNKYRGYSANVTLAKWQDVREGEEKYVFPYQDTADVVFNTALVYELSILRLYAEPLLFSIDESDPYYGEAIRLLNVLRNVLTITSESIPSDSIIREFIGDGYFAE
ncbi:MAG: nucleoside kinase, partial [Bacilli bacterium]